MPHWPKEDKCFEDEQVQVVDSAFGKKIIKNGKPVLKAWPHDKSMRQVNYEELMKVIVNPDTNEYYPARNKAGNEIKGTRAKHIVTQIIRLRRKDGKEYLYSQGAISGYDAFGNVVRRNCASPEMWTRTTFNHARVYDQRTNTTKMETNGILATEQVYEMPFNEKNLKELASLRENDADIQFSVKDEAGGSPVEVKKEANFNKTIELFLKPFYYLLKSEYITPQQKAELRQMAIDAGIIAPSTPLVPTEPAPPKGTYS